MAFVLFFIIYCLAFIGTMELIDFLKRKTDALAILLILFTCICLMIISSPYVVRFCVWVFD